VGSKNHFGGLVKVCPFDFKDNIPTQMIGKRVAKTAINATI
jgi:hypothetical protein